MAVIIEECRLQIMSKFIALNVMVKPGVPRRLCVDVVVAFAEDSRFRRKNTFVARTKHMRISCSASVTLIGLLTWV